MSPVTNLAFFRARHRQSEALAALVKPRRLEAGRLNFVSHPDELTFSSYIFLTKCAGFAPGLHSYNNNIGPLLWREGIAQDIPNGRDEFFESPVGNAHRDRSKRRPARARVGIRGAVNIRPTIETVPREQAATASALGKE